MEDNPRYEVEYHITSIHEHDHDAVFNIRRNGKVFWIRVSPAHFTNSPAATEKYMTYLKVIKSGEEVMDDVYDTDVYEWIMGPFKPLLIELAPPPPGDLSNIKISLQQNLFPEVFTFNLEVTDEKAKPRRIFTETAPFRPSFCRFDEDFLDDLETWTTIYDPAGITLSFPNPEDAFFKEPKKVLINDGKIACFFKPCVSATEAKRELRTYKAIAEAGLYDKQLKLCQMHGIAMDENDFILGLLLSYIDCADLPLSMRVIAEDSDDPPPSTRQTWIQQLDATLGELHEAGIVWGDAKAGNVLIDEHNSAWIIDFGGGYTEGWVDKALAGTIEGDAMGMANIRQLLFASAS